MRLAYLPASLAIITAISLSVAPISYAQSAPGQVQNVLIEYPSCVGNECTFTEASCSWSPTSGAATYSVKITDVNENALIKNESFSASTDIITFPVVNGRTYKCDVAAVNSAGTAGPEGSASLLCQVDQVESSPPTATPVPTRPPVKTAPPMPKQPLPKTGAIETTLMVSLSGMALLSAGTVMFFLSKR